MTHLFRTLSFCAAFGLTAVFATGPASAEDGVWVQSVAVAVDRAALQSGDPRAVDHTYRALRSAARDACSTPDRFRRTIGAPQIDYDCVAAAMDRALRDADAPALTAHAAAMDAARRGR